MQMFQCTRLEGIIERNSQGMELCSLPSRNKTETIFFVIKKMFGENITSKKIFTQNRELFYRVIMYNAYRITRNNVLIMYGFYTVDILIQYF